MKQKRTDISFHQIKTLQFLVLFKGHRWRADIMQDLGRLHSSVLLCMILAFSEEQPVSVGCTSVFWAMFKPTLLGQHHLLHSESMSLGIGCPVIRISERGYEFKYVVTNCGIQKDVLSYGMIFYASLCYTIMHKGVTGKVPLLCIVSSSSFLETTPSSTISSLTKSKSDLSCGDCGPSWNLSYTCLFGLPWVPYFQDPLVKSSHQ